MLRLTAAAAAAVMTVGLAVWATPAQAAATGVLTGRVTTSTGAPAVDVTVQVLDAEDYGYVSQASVGADGGYRVDGLDTDAYILGFSGNDIAEQYFDGQTRIGAADPVQVTSGQTTTVNEELLPAGFLTGRILDATGQPFAYRPVRALNDDGSSEGWGSTDGLGDYRIPVVAGSYRVVFEPIEGGYQRQYIPGKISSSAAALLEVTAGAETRTDDTVLGTGSISGRLTNSDGTPANDVSVSAEPFQGNEGGGPEVTTDDDGEFSVPTLLAGAYMVRFWTGDRNQYFDGAIEWDDADPVTVTAGNDTRITESLLPTGNVRVRAVDAITGVPVREFCINIGGCSDGTGQVTATGLYQGSHEIEVYPSNGNYLRRSGTVTVQPDRTTDLLVRLLPAAKVTTTVLDRATGKPLAGVCLTAYKPAHAYELEGWNDEECSDVTGKVTVGRLEATSYRLFARPLNKAYGRQWVGATGGTGDERAAVPVATKMGKTVTAPTVLIDRAGSIQGRVTADGAPVEWAGVGPLTQNPGAGAGETQTDADGRYRIDGLGPYKWALKFSSYSYATVWTGGAASRYASSGTQVTAGGTATVDIGLTRGVAVRGRLVVEHGSPNGWARINVLNTVTGDYAGTADFEGDTYELRLLPGQEILFRYSTEVNGDHLSSDRAALSPATPGGPVRYSVNVPADGLIVDVLVDQA